MTKHLLRALTVSLTLAAACGGPDTGDAPEHASAGVVAPSGSASPSPSSSPSPSPSPTCSGSGMQPLGLFSRWMCPKPNVPRGVLEDVARDPNKMRDAQRCLAAIADLVGGTNNLRGEHYDLCVTAAAAGLENFFCNGQDVFLNTCARMGIGRNECAMLWSELQIALCK